MEKTALRIFGTSIDLGKSLYTRESMSTIPILLGYWYRYPPLRNAPNFPFITSWAITLTVFWSANCSVGMRMTYST